MVALPQDVREEILRTFHTEGYIPEESELMRSIASPKKFPDNAQGQYRTTLPYRKHSSWQENLFLKKRIFREADSNPETSTGEPTTLASLVRHVFESTVFLNMVRTGH